MYYTKECFRDSFVQRRRKRSKSGGTCIQGHPQTKTGNILS